jgi:branched-chain amino acid transport system substrate-binding protein
MASAAQMALHDTAPTGTVHGRRIALAIEDSSGPSWGVVSDAVIRLALKDKVIALITSTSGADAHLSEQAGNRIGFAVMTLSADATTTQADVPWIFRIVASDAAEAQLIAQDIYSVRRLQNILLVTQHGYDGDRAAAAMRHAAAALGAPGPSVATVDDIDPQLTAVVKRIESEDPKAVVLWTNEIIAARLIPALRAADVKAPCYLPDDASFELPSASPVDRPEGEVWMVAPEVKASVSQEAFAMRFQRLTGAPPSSIAKRTYDAVTITVQALRTAGPNRARLRDALSRTRQDDGISGKISFDLEGNNPLALHLVKLQ